MSAETKSNDFHIPPEDFQSFIPIWRQSSFFGEFGDAFIKNSDLEGAPVEPGLVVLCDFLKSCCDGKEDSLTLFRPEDLSKMERIHLDMLGALNFSRSCCKTDASYVDNVNHMVKRLSDMQPGERQMVIGGWSTKTKSAHAVVYIVECCDNDTFAWVTCNTGQGIDVYHPIRQIDYPERKSKTALRIGGIRRERMISPDVWYLIFEQTAKSSDLHTPQMLYEVIIPHLSARGNCSVLEDDLQLSGPWERPQKAGTCYYRCLLSALKYMLKRDGFTIVQQRQLSLQIRLCFLQRLARELTNPTFLKELNESDAYLISLSCNETGVMAASLADRLRRSLPEDEKKQGIIERVFQSVQWHVEKVQLLVPAAQSYQLSVVESLAGDGIVALESEAELQPFTGFDLLFDESDRNLKRGYRASGSIPVYLDLLCPVVPSGASGNFTAAEHVKVIEWCLLKCDAIRSRVNVASTSTVLNQLSSFVEYVFLVLLKCPLAFIYEDDNEGSGDEPRYLWRFDASVTREQQKSGLTALLAIAQHYFAVVMSLGGDRAARTAQSITGAVIYTFFDVLIRIQTHPDPQISPIAHLLSHSFGSAMFMPPLFENMSLYEVLGGCLVTRPEVATARDGFFTYHSAMTHREGKLNLKNIFRYKVIRDRYCFIEYTMKDDRQMFISALRSIVDPDLLLQPLVPVKGRKIENSEMADVEKAYTWFSSEWTNACLEFAQYRDINVLFQLFLLPDGLNPENRGALGAVYTQSDASIVHYFSSCNRDKTTAYYLLQVFDRFIFPDLSVVEKPLKVEELVGCGEELTESGLLAQQSLPSYDDTLSPQESEQLHSYLLYPHIAIPLVLNFFGGDRIGLLMNPAIQNIVESVLFEPGRYRMGSSVATAMDIQTVPAQKATLSTSLGIMMEETIYNSEQLLTPLKELCENAFALCVGGYQSSVVSMLLFLVRQSVRVVSMCIHNNAWSETLFQLIAYLVEPIVIKIRLWTDSALADNEVAISLTLFSHCAIIYSSAIQYHLASSSSSSQIDPQRVKTYIEGFLCSTAYIVSWNSKSAADTSAEKGYLQVAPVTSDVFFAAQQLKGPLTLWAKANNDAMNEILDNVVSCSLQHPFSECSGWQRSNRDALVCSLVVENERHPYLPCSDWSQTVSFPGAASINVYFDGRSATEMNSDYVTISYPGCSLRFEGPAHSNWPGAHGSPPLIIPGDSFVIEFHSDNSVQEWGFRLTAVAPISVAGSQILMHETGMPLLSCQLALRKSCNFVEDALKFINEHREEVVRMTEIETERRKEHYAADLSPGLYQDSVDYVQVNLQSGEVFINNRVSLPVPGNFSSHKDFLDVFKDLDVPSCTILSNYTNRFSIQVLCPEDRHGCYEIEGWAPLQPYGVTGSGRGAVIKEDQEEATDNGRSTAFNLPLTGPTITHMGKQFVGYVKGSCGWMSEIFDKCDMMGSELEGIWCSEGATSLPRLSDAITDEEQDGYLLFKVHCATDGQDLLKVMGHPGAWFEVHALRKSRVLMVYALVDHGRRAQRQLVFTTDSTNVLKTLLNNPTERAKPLDPIFNRAAGNMMGGFKNWSGELVSRPGVGTRQQEQIDSIVIRRARGHLLHKDTDTASEDAYSSVYCAVAGLITSEQLAALENFPMEEYLPLTLMDSVIPECLTERFQFWRTGSRVIRGYQYVSASRKLNSRQLSDESILIILSLDGTTATVHRLQGHKRTQTLLNVSNISDDSFLKTLISVIGSIECLSHVLLWTKSGYQDSGSLKKCELSRIELPRLKTSLELRRSSRNGETVVDYVLADRDDFILQLQVPQEIASKWGVTAKFLTFRNSSGQYFLFLPNYGFRTPSVLTCPFLSNLSFDRSEKWFKNVQTRFYVYTVHSAFAYLEYPDLSAALYWTVLSFARHHYTTAARLIGTVCRSDLKLTGEQRWILTLVPKTTPQPNEASYSHPDANACRLLLTLLCISCGEDPFCPAFSNQFWEPIIDYQEYLLKVSYVSQECRLTVEQELEILSRVQNSVSSTHFTYLEALRGLHSNADNSFPVYRTELFSKTLQELKLTDMMSVLIPPPKPANQPGRNRFGRSRSTEKIFYERPNLASPEGAMAAIDAMWSNFEFAVQRTWTSEFAYSSFLMLYELLTGQIALTCFDDGIRINTGESFWCPSKSIENEQKPASEEALPDVSSSKSPSDYTELAQVLLEMDLIPDATLEKLEILLFLHDGNQEVALEEYFADPEGVIAKLVPQPKLSSPASIEAQAVQLLETGIFSDFISVPQMVTLLTHFKGNAETLTAVYFENSDDIFKILSDVDCKVEKAAADKSIPFPQSWQFAKLALECIWTQFPTLHEKKEMCVLRTLVYDVEARVKSILMTGCHSRSAVPPIFPYEKYATVLRSQEGLDSAEYEKFMETAIAYATSVIGDLEYQDDCAIDAPSNVLTHEEVAGPYLGHATSVAIPEAVSNFCNDECVIDLEWAMSSDMGSHLVCSATDITALLSCPLSVLDSFKDVIMLEHSEEVVDLPFEILGHPSAIGNPPAAAMIDRIKKDLQSSIACSEIDFSFFRGIRNVRSRHELEAIITGGCVEKIQSMVVELNRLVVSDTKAVLYGIADVERLLNATCSGPKKSNEELAFRLRVAAGRRCRLWFEYFIASLASTDQESDLLKVNPFISPELIQRLNTKVMLLLMKFVRMGQAHNCIFRAEALLGSIHRIQQQMKDPIFNDAVSDNLCHVLRHEMSELITELRKKRHYVSYRDDVPYLDPRFLIFEFITGFLLRQRQVELVNDFIAAHKSGQSSVHQMIMGAGKTQVIAPLLALMLADGNSLVTVVCPNSLLQQSRTQFRNRFSSVLQKDIITLKFERASAEYGSISGLGKLLAKMRSARAQKSVVLTTPQSIKSMMLKMVDLLLQIRKLPWNLRLFVENSHIGSLNMEYVSNDFVGSLRSFEEKAKMADLLISILKLWGPEEKGIALLDEVDLILHPLKSELNFPIGDSEPLQLMPERFELPMYLLDLFLSHGQHGKIVSHEIVHIWNEISELIDQGCHEMMFQSVPHLVLLNEQFYFSRMLLPITRWAMTWLRSQVVVKVDFAEINQKVAEDQFVAFMSGDGVLRRDAIQFVSENCSEKTTQLLNLARDWLLVYLPHVISKIHRVSFGLITESDVQRWRNQEIEAAGGDAAAGSSVVISKSRRLLAIPFDGKDAPSRTSEFANPEIQIGLSVVAYRLHGLRTRDAKDLVSHMKRNFSIQPGPFRGRPARIQFEEWKAQCIIQATATGLTSTASEILPLELLQNSDESQVDIVLSTLGKHSSVISYYLNLLVFPRALEQKSHKIQANGVDLGSDLIFGRRFGFSGTPSDLLPVELQPCHYEKGCEAEIFRVLSSSKTVSVPDCLRVGKNWTVDDLLYKVANGNYNSLIDSGALITGYTAEEVARKLLGLQAEDKEGRKEVCVFLNEHDVKMAVTLDENAPAIELERCGAKLEKRFVFYDHVHTTGIDVKHALNAIAVCTLGKDMTLRDYAQGCWRMRGLGKGQSIHLLVIEEVATLIKSTQKSDNVLEDILAWLLTNSFKSERGQFMQLQTQSLANIWRKSAYRGLLSTQNEYFTLMQQNGRYLVRSKLQVPLSSSEYQKLQDSGQIPSCWMNAICPSESVVEPQAQEQHVADSELQSSIDLFLEDTSTAICVKADTRCSPLETMSNQLTKYQNFIGQDPTGLQRAQDIMTVLEKSLSAMPKTTNASASALDADGGGAEGDEGMNYNDREIVQEQEKERDEEKEREVFQVVRPDNDDSEAAHTPWTVSELFDYSSVSSNMTFSPLKDIVINDNITPSKFNFPSDLLVSQDYMPYFHANSGRRRLKNVSCVLAWNADPRTSTVATADITAVTEVVPVSFDEAPAPCDQVEAPRKTESFFSFFGIAKKWSNKFRSREKKGATKATAEIVKNSVDVPIASPVVSHSKHFLENDPSLHCVIVSLAEAETLHYVLTRRPIEFGSIASLHCGESTSIGSPLTRPIPLCYHEPLGGEQSPFRQKFNALMLCGAFFNNQLHYDYDSLVLLLDALSASMSAADRESVFRETMKGRLRDQNQWLGSPVNWIFKYENTAELTKLRGYCNSFQSCLERHFSSFTAAFDHFSNGKYSQLGASQVYEGLVRLSENVMTLDEVAAMVNYIWDSRQRASGPVGLGLLDFEMVYPPTDASTQAIELSMDELMSDMDIPEFVPLMKRQKSTSSRPANEFYSRIHIPSIPSIGKWIVVGSGHDPTSASSRSCRSRLNISNDSTVGLDAIDAEGELVMISPRAVTLTAALWCFEMAILVPGELHVGFCVSGNTASVESHRRYHAACFTHASQGDLIRVVIGMSATRISFQHGSPIDDGVSTGPSIVITSSELEFGSGLFPYICIGANTRFQLNTGNMPFSSMFGSMPRGCHSLSHLVRREQEKNYVRYRHSLGTYGRISYMSGGHELEVERVENWSANGTPSSPVKGPSPIESHVWELMPPKGKYKKEKGAYETAFPTVFLDGVLLTQGQWYYEVTCGCKNVAVQLGWSDLDSLQHNDRGLGVGDDKHSWAIDGDRCVLWHQDSINYGSFWKIGDVCGIACDLDVNARTISFCLNGQWFKPTAFTNIDFSVGLTPALTVQGVQVGDKKALSYTVNFGPHFKYPPGGKYLPVSDRIKWGLQQFITPLRSQIEEPEGGGDLGPSLAANEDDLPPDTPLMSRLLSAQPEIVPLKLLSWVPMIVRSGHGQVSIEPPVFRNGPAMQVIDKGQVPEGPCLKKTTVTTTGEDNLSYPSMVADRCFLKTGKWCYEVDIVAITPTALCSIGFADAMWNEPRWTDKHGVGDDNRSWAVFFKTDTQAVISKWNNTVLSGVLFDLSGAPNTLVSLCVGVDLDEKKMFLSINNQPMITAVNNFSSSLLVPAISLQARGDEKKKRAARGGELPRQTQVEVNFGETAFKNSEFIDAGFLPVLHQIRSQQESIL